MVTLWKLSMLRHIKDCVDGELQVSHLPLVPPRSAYMGGRDMHASLSSKAFW